MNYEKVKRKTLPLEALLREKRPLLLDEARADPDHLSYREYFGKKVRIKKSGARHHSGRLNSPFNFVYESETESDDDAEEEEDEFEFYCVNCNIRLNGAADAPLCLTCVLTM